MPKKIALAAGTTVVCLLLAELVIRLLGLAPGVTRIKVDLPHGSFESSANPVLRYVPKPGTGGVNSYGIRDHEYPVARPPGGLRILTIGDSVGYGFCNDQELLPVDSLFVNRLERRLQARSAAPVEVINLSVSGYDTVQEVAFLEEKGLDLEPDIVLVAYCLNDNFDASKELMTLMRDPQFGIDSEIGRRLFLRSHLLRLFMLSGWSHDQERAPETVSRTERGFRRLAKLGREHGFQPVIVVFPLFEPLETYRWGGLHEEAARLAQANRLPVLDLMPAFLEASDGDLLRLQGRCNREHPDENGHRVAARTIETYLLDTGILGLN